MPQFGDHPSKTNSASQSATPTLWISSPAPEADPPIVHIPETVHGENEDFDSGEELDGAFTAVGNADQDLQKSKHSQPLKMLNVASMPSPSTAVATAESYASTAKPVYDSDAMKAVREGVSMLVESLPGLVKALDEVAKIHPFIGIAVGAFRVVVELGVKRRDNDKKIGVLFVEMRDMMEALLQLRGIKDEESVGPDGQMIKARMQELVKQTADDIKKCANACEAYAKKRLIVKVIKGSAWDGTLKGFIDLFASRRKALMFALSIHVGVGVDDVNRRLKEIDAKIDMVLDFFSKVVSPEQQELAALVQKKGGPTAVMGDNETLKELLKFTPATAIGQAKRRGGRDGVEHNSHFQDGDDLAVVKQELFDSPELAIRKNLEVFEHKFEMQQRVLAEEMRQVVHHEGDRVIEVVTSGPHDRIVDPDIHEIWKEMRWPGHVKTRYFVIALRDYYRQQVDSKRKACFGDSAVSRVASQDEWALRWISINSLQAISEAFDDDASGFITTMEVNRFTASRPKGWSLPHWLAYWAIGWQMAATKYRDMIDNICAKMFAIRPHVHPANRCAVDKYLQTVWKRTSTLTSSFTTTYQCESLEGRFRSFVEGEEKRLREGLELVKYQIDAMDTLLLVTGPGCVEKYLFPLLWLLLRRDFGIFRQCRNTVIPKDELWQSANTIASVFRAVSERHSDLEVLFEQQKMDTGRHFKAFASELFDYWHDSEKFWSLENLRTLDCPSAALDLYPQWADDPITENEAAADEAAHLILGRWNGYIVLPGGLASYMMTFCLHASVDHTTYEASAILACGTYFNVLGTYTAQIDGTVAYTFTQAYVAQIQTRYFTGALVDDGATLSGNWGYGKDHQPYTFVLVDRPHPQEFTKNRVKALWKYALTATHNQVRRQLFSWSCLKARRDLSVVRHLSTFDDVRCLYVLRDYSKQTVLAHFGITCDHRGGPIYGTRVVCMECGSRTTFDFCDKPACVGCTVKTRDDFSSPHLPTHDFVKIRTPIVQHREIGKVLRNAMTALERVKVLLMKGGTHNTRHEEAEKADGEREEILQRDEKQDGDAPTLTCLKCKSPVSQPCLYCVDCPKDSRAFICWECDAREAGFSHGKYHLATHTSFAAQ
ncbi:hypothetical protein V8D89_013292 [Ganoderma adspersum]